MRKFIRRGSEGERRMRALLALGLIVVCIWASAIALLYFIEVAMVPHGTGWTKSLLGLFVFALWVAAWGAALLTLSRLIVRLSSKRAPQPRAGDR